MILAAGCGGGDDDEGVSGEDLEPRALVLRQSDLPRGFVVDRALTGAVENSEVATGRPAGYEQKLEEWGRIGGYSRILRRRGEAGEGVRGADGVTSVASVYEDEDGAAESFETGVRDYADAGFAPQGDLGIGDEGRVYRGTGTDGAGRQVEYTVATWRRAPVIATVVVEAGANKIEIPTVRELARKQDRLVQAAIAE